jgi:hypothetical protein
MTFLATSRSVSRASATAFALLAACHSTTPPGAAPADFSTSLYRLADETVTFEPPDHEAIYRSVLHFYRPAGAQARWLDPHLLPAAPADTGRTLDDDLAHRLIRALGPSRFCLQEEAAGCGTSSGGVVRLSPVYGLSSDRARLIVRFEGVAPPYAGGTAYSGTEAFLLERHAGDWRIRAHAPAGS